MKKSLLVLLLAGLTAGYLYAAGETLNLKIKNSRTDYTAEQIWLQVNNENCLYLDDAFQNPVIPGKAIQLSTLSKSANPDEPDTYLLYTQQEGSNSAVRLFFSLGKKLPDGTNHSCTDSNMKDVRYDWLEATFDGTPSACINLTSLEQLGIAFSIKSYKSGTLGETFGWKKSLNEVATKAKAMVPESIVGTIDTTSFVRIKGAQKYPDLWIKGIEGIFTEAAGKKISITGYFNGVAGIDPEAGLGRFTGSFDSTGKTVTIKGSFSNNNKSATMIVPDINIESIYAADPFGDCKPKAYYDDAPDTDLWTGTNDRWTFLFNFLMTGFNAGFWANEETCDTFSWTTATEFQGTSYNHYSALIHNSSNSYGDPYSDNVKGNKVQLNLAPENVDTLFITILPDDQAEGYTPTEGSLPGYQLSCPVEGPSVPHPVKQIVFNNDTDNPMTVSKGVAKFPVSTVTGCYNKLSFVYDTTTPIDECPFISVYIPVNPLDTPPSGQKILYTGWKNLTVENKPTADLWWESQKTGEVFEILHLSGNVVPANFTLPGKTTLSMKVNPENGGTTTPAVGDTSVRIGAAQIIKATPKAGATFKSWDGDDSIFNKNDAITSIIPIENPTATANFSEHASPTVTTTDISGIGAGSAFSGGNVTDDGGSTVTARGVCWSTAENPTTEDSKTEDGSGDGAFTSKLSGLTVNTPYYVRAYATNSQGTAYGEQKSFTTTAPSLPTVKTTDISDIGTTTATGGGDVTDHGGSTVTARGVCWSTTENPTIENSKTEDGTGDGVFTSKLSGLTVNTPYYVRAYATNSQGTAYGEQKSFTTNVDKPTVTTTEISELGANTATSGGNITNDGGVTVTARGVCWSTAENPTVADSKTEDGTGTGTFTSVLVGLTVNTKYYLRAYATNSQGTAYGEQRTFTTKDSDVLVLTMEVSPKGAGTTTPATVKVVKKGVPEPVTATAAEGMIFAGWKVSKGYATVDGTGSSANATLLTNTTLTACFVNEKDDMPKITINLNSTKENKDKVVINKAVLPNLADFDQEKDTVSISIDGYEFTCDNTGIWKVSGKEEKGFKYTYKSAKDNVHGKFQLILDFRNQIWTFKVVKATINKTVDNSDGVTIYLKVNEKRYGNNYKMDEKTTWLFRGKTNTADTIKDLTGTPMTEFNFGIKSKATGKYNSTKEGKDSFNWNNCSIQLPDGYTFDPSKVTVSIDSIEFPVELVQKNENKKIYTYKSTTDPKIIIKIDLEKKNIWSFKMTKGDCSKIYSRNGIDIILKLGDYIGGQTLNVYKKSKLTHKE